ncbi:hypothetical protein HXZ66_01040 [Bacillus sp. A116_S68]|nr:hypothetical protein HXZ66_01040 [Bacillus sp. A116_S68]
MTVLFVSFTFISPAEAYRDYDIGQDEDVHEISLYISNDRVNEIIDAVYDISTASNVVGAVGMIGLSVPLGLAGENKVYLDHLLTKAKSKTNPRLDNDFGGPEAKEFIRA